MATIRAIGPPPNLRAMTPVRYTDPAMNPADRARRTTSESPNTRVTIQRTAMLNGG